MQILFVDDCMWEKDDVEPLRGSGCTYCIYPGLAPGVINVKPRWGGNTKINKGCLFSPYYSH